MQWAIKRRIFTYMVKFLLLIIIAQLGFSLFASRGVFVSTEDVTISPFNLCYREQKWGETKCYLTPTIGGLVVLCLYMPVVFVLFGSMAYLFAVSGEDEGVLLVSVVCLGISTNMMLMGLGVFVGGHLAYVSWSGMTASFYLSVLACGEMEVATVLSWKTKRILTKARSLDQPRPEQCQLTCPV